MSKDHSAEKDVPECDCESLGGRFGAHRAECPWQVAYEAQLAAESDAAALQRLRDLLDRTEADARAHQHLARLSVREIRECVFPPEGSCAMSAEKDADLWCNACIFGECQGCWSEDPAPWPEWAGEPFECRCPHRPLPPEVGNA